MFNNLTKLIKLLTRKISMEQVLSYFSCSTDSIKIFRKYKELGSIKNFLEIKL